MQRLKEKLDNTLGYCVLGLSGLISLGMIYWLWLAFKMGSIGMAVVGVIPPISMATGSVGAWSMIFGTPEWVSETFS